MKRGWQLKRFGDICTFDKLQALHNHLPYVGLEHIESHTGRFIGSLDPQSVKSLTFRFSRNHVLYGRLRPYLNKVLVPDFEGHCSTEIFPIKPSPLLSREYLTYWLLSDTTVDHINATCTGARMPRANMNEVLDFDFPLPPIPEQQRIVGILDEAFAGIATARANAEKNLQNARAVFESQLQAIFSHDAPDGSVISSEPTTKQLESKLQKTSAITNRYHPKHNEIVCADPLATKTGGRHATLQHIPGGFSLAVGMPKTQPKNGWRWSLLTDLARLESGHTPSRRHPEYWGGAIPWLGIRDAREWHGRRVDDTIQKINELGIANSSARLLPAGTVCLSRTASVGYVVVMGRQMATSQDFVNWVCSDDIAPDFLKYLLMAGGRSEFLRFSNGSVHQTIYFPEVKAFHICHPHIHEQLRLVSILDSLKDESEHLESVYQKKLGTLDELKKSLLHQAFSGQL